MMIKKSEVKNYIRNLGDYNVSKEIYNLIDDRVKTILEHACARATSNKRKTVQSQDV